MSPAEKTARALAEALWPGCFPTMQPELRGTASKPTIVPITIRFVRSKWRVVYVARSGEEFVGGRGATRDIAWADAVDVLRRTAQERVAEIDALRAERDRIAAALAATGDTA